MRKGSKVFVDYRDGSDDENYTGPAVFVRKIGPDEAIRCFGSNDGMVMVKCSPDDAGSVFPETAVKQLGTLPSAKPKIPRARSKGEASLEQQMQIDGLPFVKEYRFHPVRRWRADFALVQEKILIEVEGMGGAHQTARGFREDAEKYLAAACLGWIVIRCTVAQACSGEALEAIHCMRARIQNQAIARVK